MNKRPLGLCPDHTSSPNYEFQTLEDIDRKELSKMRGRVMEKDHLFLEIKWLCYPEACEYGFMFQSVTGHHIGSHPEMIAGDIK